jgi:hypothetical protein
MTTETRKWSSSLIQTVSCFLRVLKTLLPMGQSAKMCAAAMNLSCGGPNARRRKTRASSLPLGMSDISLIQPGKRSANAPHARTIFASTPSRSGRDMPPVNAWPARLRATRMRVDTTAAGFRHAKSWSWGPCGRLKILQNRDRTVRERPHSSENQAHKCPRHYLDGKGLIESRPPAGRRRGVTLSQSSASSALSR